MKFNRLRLTNIGAFRDRYDLNLEIADKQRNVVLFGGQNGSGKTTILEAIRLALFGPLSFGYKTDTDSYYDNIEAKLNTIAKKSGDDVYQIILDFEMVENLQTWHYTINRRWVRKRSKLKEELQIQRNGKILSDKETEIFQTKLREETPPQLLEFCLFDGERIAQIISDETLSSYLRETAKVVFNLDLFENLESDLDNFIKQDSIYGSLSDEERKLHETESHKDRLLREKELQLQLIQHAEAEIQEKVSMLAENNRQFEIYGGLLKEQRETLISEMNKIERERGVIIERNKEFISTLLPFVLMQDLVKSTAGQLSKESNYEVQSSVKQLISASDIQSILDSMKHEALIDSHEAMDTLADKFYENLLGLLSSESVNVIHRASFQQRAEIEAIYRDISNFDINEIHANYKRNSKMLEDIRSIRRQIDESHSDDLQKLIQVIYELKAEIDSEQEKIAEYHVTLTKIDDEIAQVSRDCEALKAKVVLAKKAENVFTITNRVLDVSRAFRTMQLQKKLKHVELEAARMLQLLFRKEFFVTRVAIDPQTFHLQIYNDANEEIKKEALSAGEKQILLLATIWAMVMCSKRRIPFVFDTLLGRLDQAHKKSIVTELVPRCGEQVVILSTDSEIDHELYEDIKPYVSKAYTIDYQTSESKVQVRPGYFANSEQEVIPS